MRRMPLLIVALLLAVLAGCQRLNIKKTYELTSTSAPYQELEIDAPKSEQKVLVKATSDNPVTVYIVLQEDKEDILSAIERGKTPTKTLGSQENAKEISVEATIPAKKTYLIYVCLGTKVDKATVELHATAK